MKKKIILVFAVMAILACIFAVSANAAVVTDTVKYSYFPQDYVTESIEEIEVSNHIHADILRNYPDVIDARIRLKCSCEQGYHIYPTYYVTSKQYNDYFRFDYTEINKIKPCGKTYNKNSIIALEIPNGFTIFDGYGKDNNYGVRASTSLEYVDMSNSTTLVTLEPANDHEPFVDCKTLKYVKMASVTTNIPGWCFIRCENLLICDIPEDSQIEKIGTQAFKGCSKLTALYLPDTVKSIGYLSDGETTQPSGNTDDTGTEGDKRSTFYGCTNLFFVNNPEDTEKPSIYYMPENLEKVTGELFKNLDKLNSVIVFGENFKYLNNGFAFAQVNSGTFIFEGDFTAENTKFEYSCEMSNINMYFTHENVKDGSFITYATSWNGATPSKCYANICSNGTRAELTKQNYPTQNATFYAVLTFVSDGFAHIAENVVDVQASCEVDAGKATYCFCGYEISKEAIEDTALSHDYDYLNNDKAILVGIVYSDYSKSGIKNVICANCGEEAALEAPALFACVGYSAAKNGDLGIAIGFTVNVAAVEEYTREMNKTVKYGVFAVSQSNLADKDVFDADGKATAGVINTELSSFKSAAFDLKITGFDDNNKDTEFAMGAYVAISDGETTEYSYIQDRVPSGTEKYCYDSFSSILANLNTQD